MPSAVAVFEDPARSERILLGVAEPVTIEVAARPELRVREGARAAGALDHHLGQVIAQVPVGRVERVHRQLSHDLERGGGLQLHREGGARHRDAEEHDAPDVELDPRGARSAERIRGYGAVDGHRRRERHAV